MYTAKRCIAMVVLLLFTATPCLAAENTFKSLFEDCLYGGLTGTLVGAAVMVFTKKPANHLDYMGYGAAGGVLVGAAYGVVTTARSLATVENGSVKFAFPTIVPEIGDTNSKGQTPIIATAEIIRGKF